MEKNWLIRTQYKKILGPISKEKVIEFIEKGSLKPEDEISSGNGYWFWIKEKDLVEKFVFNGEAQSFNPISESSSVLGPEVGEIPVVNRAAPVPEPEPELEIQLPEEDDLEYPDLEGESTGEDITTVIRVDGMELDSPDTSELEIDDSPLDLDSSGDIVLEAPVPSPSESLEVQETETSEEEESLLPAEDDLEYPEMEAGEAIDLTDDDHTDPNVSIPSDSLIIEEDVSGEEQNVEFVDESDFEEEAEEEDVKPKSSNLQKKKTKKLNITKPEKQKDDRWLFYVLIFLVLSIFGFYYYYRKLINKPFIEIGANMIVSRVEAQMVDTALVKKKDFSPIVNFNSVK